MTRFVKLSSALAVTIFLGSSAWWLRGQQEDARPLPSVFPPGALLYLEAKHFHDLLQQWNLSSEKKAWLASDNFGILSRSRLVQRLGQAQDEFTTVAGFPVQIDLLDELAGNRTAFAFYDLANLRFVYLTEFDASRLDASSLWRTRSKSQTREVAGIPFYVKSDGANHRSIVFAHYRDWLIVGTAESLVAQTLTLLSGAKAQSLAHDDWFSGILKRRDVQGDLRLVYNLDTLLPTPQLRTYWIQRNVSELKEFTAGIADLFKDQNGFEEQRVLSRRNALSDPLSQSSLDEILHYVPQSSSLYRAWALPERNLVTGILQQVVLGSSAQVQSLDRYAPQVSSEAREAGLASDFETRIDEQPLRPSQSRPVTSLVNAVLDMQPTAVLHIQTTSELADNVFILPQSAAVIECLRPDKPMLDQSLRATADILETGSLDRLNVSVAGNLIILSRLNVSRSTMAPRFPAGTSYAAAFNPLNEWPHYKQLFSVIDHSPVNPEAGPTQNTPTFFSGNVQSLGDSLSRLQRISISTQDLATDVQETVRYDLKVP